MHETLCHKIECISIGNSLFRMNQILSYVKCTGLAGNFSWTLSIVACMANDVILQCIKSRFSMRNHDILAQHIYKLCDFNVIQNKILYSCSCVIKFI